MDAVEFVQTPCEESRYSGNRLRITINRNESSVEVTLTSESGDEIDRATFGSGASAYQLAHWIELRADW